MYYKINKLPMNYQTKTYLSLSLIRARFGDNNTLELQCSHKEHDYFKHVYAAKIANNKFKLCPQSIQKVDKVRVP